ncbi:MAG: hypothetical protein MJ238_06920 [Bacilli bacterium]|nr:hypothetical protein [Bacilli bacterium]
MKDLPSIAKLTNSFSKLPGVGVKSAERMAYAILSMNPEDVEEFIEALDQASHNIHKCPNCGVYTEDDMCEICSDENRDHTVIAVVAEPKDVLA